MHDSVTLTIAANDKSDLDALERRVQRIATLNRIQKPTPNFPDTARLYEAVFDILEPHLPTEMPAVSVTLDRPSDRSESYTSMTERGLMMNITLTGIGGIHATVSDEEFIRVNTALLREDGPVQYLTNMLYILRTILGCTISRTEPDNMLRNPRPPEDAVTGYFRIQVSTPDERLHQAVQENMTTILNLYTLHTQPPHRIYEPAPPTHNIYAPSPTVQALPTDSRAPKDQAMLTGVWCNPLVAGCGPFTPSSPDDYAWIKQAARLAYIDGPEQYLANMIAMLRQTYRQRRSGQ